MMTVGSRTVNGWNAIGDEECTNPRHAGYAKERQILREEVARLHREVDLEARDKARISDALGAMEARMKKVVDERDAKIKSLEHQLAIYTNANSSSGQDPRGYEDTKKFQRDSDEYEKAKKGKGGGGDAGGQPQETRKKGGGQPGHVGKSHNIKPSETKYYKAEMCENCGRTDLELLKTINVLKQDFGDGMEGKRAHMAMVTFGWCGVCWDVTDPTSNFNWGSSLTGRVRATVIQYKSNPIARRSTVENLKAINGFEISAGAVSNATTAEARRLEGRVLTDSVAAFVKAKVEASLLPGGDAPPLVGDAPRSPDAPPCDASRTPCRWPADCGGSISAGGAGREAGEAAEAAAMPDPAGEAAEAAAMPDPAGDTAGRPPLQGTEADGADRDAQAPQEATDERLTRQTTSYPGSHGLSFVELCREFLTMAPYIWADESKTTVAGSWCHSVVAVAPNVVMITVLSHKNIPAINILFSGMQNRLVVHDRIQIYNGFSGKHQECWVHLIRQFLAVAMRHGIGTPEYDHLIIIRGLFKRAKTLAELIADLFGAPRNAAEMSGCRNRLLRNWDEFEAEYKSILAALRALADDIGDKQPATYLNNMMPRILTALQFPGAPLHNNAAELSNRWFVVRFRNVFVALPCRRAAKNFGTLVTFAATCRKNGLSPYKAILNASRDVDIFRAGLPPPILRNTS